MAATTTIHLPIIDLGKFIHGTDEERQQVAQEIRGAATDYGVFYIKNHGVPKDLIERMFQQAKRYFDLPLEEKEKIPVDMTYRGYTGNLKEYASVKAVKTDVKECFTLMNELPPDDEYLKQKGGLLYGPNKWPENLPGFRECVYDEYYKTLTILSDRIREAFAVSLKLPPSYFDSITRKPIVTLRFNHYLPLPPIFDPEQVNCGIHTDNDAFTVLAQDDVGGLELQLADGTFAGVPPVKDTFVINVGDFLERWSNGRYKAPPHRVVTPTNKERYSIGYHSGVDYNAIIQPSVPDEEPKYPAETAGGYFDSVEVPAHVFTLPESTPA